MEQKCLYTKPRARHKAMVTQFQDEKTNSVGLLNNALQQKLTISLPMAVINLHNKTVCFRCCQNQAKYVCPECRNNYFCQLCYQFLHNSSKPWLHSPISLQSIKTAQKSINKAIKNTKPLSFDLQKINRYQREYINKSNTVYKQNKKYKDILDINQLFKCLQLLLITNIKNGELKQHEIKLKWKLIQKNIQKQYQQLNQILQASLNSVAQQINIRCQQQIKASCKNYFTNKEMFEIQQIIISLQNEKTNCQLSCQQNLIQKINKFIKKQKEQLKNINQSSFILTPIQMFQQVKNRIKSIEPKSILPIIQVNKFKEQRILGNFENIQLYEQSKCKTTRKANDKNKSFLNPTRHSTKRRRSKDHFNNLNISTFSLSGQQQGLKMKKIKSQTNLPIQISDCRILKIDKKNKISEGITKKNTQNTKNY